MRTDPLTGLGSRGALQLDLESDCAQATEEEPISVLLFDLNGFKRYNDSFGHPAGDELLAELGARLRAELGEDGVAYRVGGDEFCVVLDCPKGRFGEVTRKAAMAFTTSRNGVEVGSSWGAVTVPGEASSALEAMQLADLRMYAQKESRRAARDTAVEQALNAAELEHEEPALDRGPVEA